MSANLPALSILALLDHYAEVARVADDLQRTGHSGHAAVEAKQAKDAIHAEMLRRVA